MRYKILLSILLVHLLSVAHAGNNSVAPSSTSTLADPYQHCFNNSTWR